MKNNFILRMTKFLMSFFLIIFLYFVVGTHVNSQAVDCQNINQDSSYFFTIKKDKYSLTLVIKYTSQGCQVLANGKDYATITAQLSKHAPDNLDDKPIKVRLQEGGIGELNEKDLIIPENAQNSQNNARLTSKIPGQSIVDYQVLLPGGTWMSGKSIKVNFVEPLKISLAASPPKNMFFGSLIRSGITASLTDNNNKFKNSNEERRINLSIVKGHGTFLQDGKHYNNVTLVIPSGQSSASIDFVPNQAGNVTIKADSSSMESVITEVDFSIPLIPITIAGILGSVMALLNNSINKDRENQKSWKVILPLGIISGLVLSIVSLFFLASFNPSFDQSWAFLISLISSLIGGWFGPERIFEPILNRLTASNQPSR